LATATKEPASVTSVPQLDMRLTWQTPAGHGFDTVRPWKMANPRTAVTRTNPGTAPVEPSTAVVVKPMPMWSAASAVMTLNTATTSPSKYRSTVPTSSTAETFRNQPLLTVDERPVQDWMPIVARDASVVPQRTASLVAMDRTGVVMEAVRAEPVKVNGIVQPRSNPRRRS
jgi:hypothetical protein